MTITTHPIPGRIVILNILLQPICCSYKSKNYTHNPGTDSVSVIPSVKWKSNSLVWLECNYNIFLQTKFYFGDISWMDLDFVEMKFYLLIGEEKRIDLDLIFLITRTFLQNLHLYSMLLVVKNWTFFFVSVSVWCAINL